MDDVASSSPPSVEMRELICVFNASWSPLNVESRAMPRGSVRSRDGTSGLFEDQPRSSRASKPES